MSKTILYLCLYIWKFVSVDALYCGMRYKKTVAYTHKKMLGHAKDEEHMTTMHEYLESFLV